MIHNGILLYLQIGAQPTYYRGFLQQLMAADAQTHCQSLGGEKPKLETMIGSLPLELTKPYRRRWKRVVSTRGVEYPKRIWPTGSTKQDSQALIETEAVIMEPAWVGNKCFAYMLWILAWYFSLRFLTMGVCGGLSLSLLLLRPFSY